MIIAINFRRLLLVAIAIVLQVVLIVDAFIKLNLTHLVVVLILFFHYLLPFIFKHRTFLQMIP